MKPKVYRKTKSTKGSDIRLNKSNSAGGKVNGVIKGPISSIGDEATFPSVEQGNDKSNPNMRA
jgi:hypothetical protein